MLMLADLVGDPRPARHELRAGKGAQGLPPGRPAPAEGDSGAGSAQAESRSNHKRVRWPDRGHRPTGALQAGRPRAMPMEDPNVAVRSHTR